jgi:hypothetical protein
MGRLGIVIVTAVLAMFPPVASAGWRIDRAKEIAAIVWRHPCNDQVALMFDDLPYSEGVIELASADECEVHMALQGPGLNGDRWGWDEFCTVVIHAYGHLAGFRDPANVSDPLHSRNPDSVMENQSGIRLIDGRCVSRGRLYLERHGVLA